MRQEQHAFETLTTTRQRHASNEHEHKPQYPPSKYAHLAFLKRLSGMYVCICVCAFKMHKIICLQVVTVTANANGLTNWGTKMRLLQVICDQFHFQRQFNCSTGHPKGNLPTRGRSCMAMCTPAVYLRLLPFIETNRAT